jgi:hypothetical protein
MLITARRNATSPSTSSASTTASDCTRLWVTCRPPPTSGKWQQHRLSWCLRLLDHYTAVRPDFAYASISARHCSASLCTRRCIAVPSGSFVPIVDPSKKGVDNRRDPLLISVRHSRTLTGFQPGPTPWDGAVHETGCTILKNRHRRVLSLDCNACRECNGAIDQATFLISLVPCIADARCPFK